MVRILVVVAVLMPTLAFAHCDTLDGPVVVAARAALDKGEVTPVLKWIKPEHEAEVRTVFEQTLQVRKLGPQARELADTHFLETLVRLHRAGEGAPYTGLKPAGAEVDHSVVAADEALKTGSDTELIRMLTQALQQRLHQRFERTHEARKHADETVAAGREYVAAYVDYVHYVEGVHQAIIAAHGEHAAAAPEHAH